MKRKKEEEEETRELETKQLKVIINDPSEGNYYNNNSTERVLMKIWKSFLLEIKSRVWEKVRERENKSENSHLRAEKSS